MFEFFKKKELNIWKVFSDETNAKFISAKYDQSAKTEIIYDNWKIIFDNYINYIVVGNSSSEKTYTRVVVPYESIDNFRFEIYKSGFIRNIEKFFGVQDVELGIPKFDKKFIIKSNNEFKIKNLLQNLEIRNLIESLKDVNIETSNKKGIWEQELPEKQFELSFYVLNEIKNTSELKELLKLLKLLIDQLVLIKSIKSISNSIIQ